MQHYHFISFIIVLLLLFLYSFFLLFLSLSFLSFLSLPGHNRCKTNVCISRPIDSKGYAVRLHMYIFGNKKVYLGYNRLPETSTQLVCLSWGFPLAWSANLSFFSTMALNIDRLLETMATILYGCRLDKIHCYIQPDFLDIAYRIWLTAFYTKNLKLVPLRYGTILDDKCFQNICSLVNLEFFLSSLGVLWRRLRNFWHCPFNKGNKTTYKIVYDESDRSNLIFIFVFKNHLELQYRFIWLGIHRLCNY